MPCPVQAFFFLVPHHPHPCEQADHTSRFLTLTYKAEQRFIGCATVYQGLMRHLDASPRNWLSFFAWITVNIKPQLPFCVFSLAENLVSPVGDCTCIEFHHANPFSLARLLLSLHHIMHAASPRISLLNLKDKHQGIIEQS